MSWTHSELVDLCLFWSFGKALSPLFVYVSHARWAADQPLLTCDPHTFWYIPPSLHMICCGLQTVTHCDRSPVASWLKYT